MAALGSTLSNEEACAVARSLSPTSTEPGAATCPNTYCSGYYCPNTYRSTVTGL